MIAVIIFHLLGEEILELLLAAKNVDVNTADHDEATPLHYACLKNNYKAVRKLIIAKNINLEVSDTLLLYLRMRLHISQTWRPLYGCKTFPIPKIVELCLSIFYWQKVLFNENG